MIKEFVLLWTQPSTGKEFDVHVKYSCNLNCLYWGDDDSDCLSEENWTVIETNPKMNESEQKELDEFLSDCEWNELDETEYSEFWEIRGN